MDRLRMGILVAIAMASISCSGPSTESPIATLPPGESTSTEMDFAPSTSQSSPTARPGVLVFHRTEGFRHASIEAGVGALVELGSSSGYEVSATEDSAVFTAEGLEPYTVLIFLNTTGDVLDATQESAMEDFIRSGRGFVGIHSAADTEYDWDWYGGLVGAYFEDHPAPQTAVVEVTSSHPVVEGFPARVERFDEWYNFKSLPNSEATVLATLDETTYEGGAMGSNHPIIWTHSYQGGRAVYIGFGHTEESFEEPLVRTLLDNAVRWAGSLD